MSAGCLRYNKLCILITVIVTPSSLSDLAVPQVASGTLISSLLSGLTQLINYGTRGRAGGVEGDNNVHNKGAGSLVSNMLLIVNLNRLERLGKLECPGKTLG